MLLDPVHLSPVLVVSVHFFELKGEKRAKALWQTTDGPTQGAALLLSAARSFHGALKNEGLTLCDVSEGVSKNPRTLLFKAQTMITDMSPHCIASIVQAQISSVCSSANDHLLGGLNSSDSPEGVRLKKYLIYVCEESLLL